MPVIGVVLATIAWGGACSLDDAGLPSGEDGTSTGGDGASSSGRAAANVCGNGTIDPGEECDDENRNLGDGCSPTCKKEGLDACPGLGLTLSPSGQSIHGHLAEQGDDAQPSCGPDRAPDVIYAFTPTVSGTASATLSSTEAFSKSISLRSACPDNGPAAERSCSSNSSGEALSLRAWVLKGVTYYLIIDGEPHDFTLDLSLSECGDNMQEGLEECDSESCRGCVTCMGPNEFWDGPKNRCYRFFEESRSFADARQSCTEWGGDLVGIGSKSELDAVALGLGQAAPEIVWTGGYALSVQCAYVWPDSDVFTQDDWEVGQPDNMSPPESCVSLHRQATGDYKLVDEACSAAHPYLCERVPATSCGAECQRRCRTGEFIDPFTSHCYTVSTGLTPLSFAAAEQSCKEHGGYLAVISSEEEDALVAAHLTKSSWIGGKFSSVLEWQWQNGEPFCFARWHSGEPTVGEDCIEMYKDDGSWNNTACENEREFVCEREP